MDWGYVGRLLVIGGIVGVLVPWLMRRVRRRRLRRQPDAGRTWVAARAPERAQPGLSTQWRHVNAAPAAGRVALTKRLAGGKDPVIIDVRGVRPGRRDPTMRETLVLDDVLDDVLTLDTPAGPVELAVARAQTQWLRDQLTGVGDPEHDAA